MKRWPVLLLLSVLAAFTVLIIPGEARADTPCLCYPYYAAVDSDTFDVYVYDSDCGCYRQVPDDDTFNELNDDTAGSGWADYIFNSADDFPASVDAEDPWPSCDCGDDPWPGCGEGPGDCGGGGDPDYVVVRDDSSGPFQGTRVSVDTPTSGQYSTLTTGESFLTGLFASAGDGNFIQAGLIYQSADASESECYTGYDSLYYFTEIVFDGGHEHTCAIDGSASFGGYDAVRSLIETSDNIWYSYLNGDNTYEATAFYGESCGDGYDACDITTQGEIKGDDVAGKWAATFAGDTAWEYWNGSSWSYVTDSSPISGIHWDGFSGSVPYGWSFIYCWEDDC